MRLSLSIRLASVLPLVLAALATACDGPHGTVTEPTTVSTRADTIQAVPPSTPASGELPITPAPLTLSETEQATIAAQLAAGGFVAPAPFNVKEVWTKERPPYNQVYESCLVMFAITGAAQGRPIADAYCNALAIQGSQHERPNWTDQVRSYFSCLFVFTIHPAPRNVDMGRVCNRPGGDL